jgi:hypothetical protein
MSITKRFILQRKKILEKVFTKKNLIDTWRKVVKKQMRSLDIIDIHDYYDFNYNIENISEHIQYEIIEGKYQVSKPLMYKLEKKYGICRHLMIPSPKDALIFQVLVDYIIRQDLKQPSQKAFFSRDKSEPKLPHQVDTNDYSWRTKWKKFQKEIFKFSENFEFLAVTDIANYFDNIGLKELRNIVSSYVKVEEVILDLLFKMIEDLSWKPDYLPYTYKGLPTINLEAIRFLAHVMLFEIDEFLKQETADNFVRWMDDINIGCNNKSEAKKILGNMNDILKSRGLALNLAKTNIYTSDEVKYHFLVEENLFINKMEKKIKNNDFFDNDKKELYSFFEKHLQNKDSQNWDKVTKRFFTLAGKIQDKKYIKYGEKFFIERPSLRQHILYFLDNFNFEKNIMNVIYNLYDKVEFYDDMTFFLLTKFLINFNIPLNSNTKEFIGSLKEIYNKEQKNKFGYYCNLWFYGKYGEDNELLTLIENKKSLWTRDSFLSRQVVSVLPRIYYFKQDNIEKIIEEQISNGFYESSFVAKNIKNLLSKKSLDKKLKPYLFYKDKRRKYPFSKFLILLTILNNNQNKNDLINKIKSNIVDEWYLYHINKILKKKNLN